LKCLELNRNIKIHTSRYLPRRRVITIFAPFIEINILSNKNVVSV
jgi:hypothetical protein